MTFHAARRTHSYQTHLGASEQAHFLQAALDVVPDAVVVYDTKGSICYTNQAFNDLVAMLLSVEHYDHAVPDSACHLVANSAARSNLAGDLGSDVHEMPGRMPAVPCSMDLLVRLKDGLNRVFRVTGAPIHDDTGRIAGVACVLRDATEQCRHEEERKRLERERNEARARELALRDVTRHMDQFVATAAHDIRSPVATARGNIQLALHDLMRLVPSTNRADVDLIAQQAEVLDSLHQADQSMERLAQLVTRLLDVARARTGIINLRAKISDLGVVVREQVDAQRAAAPDRVIRLQVSAEHPVWVLADVVRIGQVVTNYLTNALKYSPADRPVDVFLEEYGNHVCVSVRDQGPGVPQCEQALVWDMFYRSPGVDLQGGAGDSLGLGLSICKTNIECHGGKVGVESEVGVGSTFWFTLPLARTAGRCGDEHPIARRSPHEVRRSQ